MIKSTDLHRPEEVIYSALFSVGQWVRVVDWCSRPWIEGPIVSLGTKNSDDLKVRVIRGSTFHRGRVFTMPRKNATPLNVSAMASADEKTTPKETTL